jgi:hypothetical protein
MDFFARKIRQFWPGSNPQSWVPEASMLTTRPPKVPEASILTTRTPKPIQTPGTSQVQVLGYSAFTVRRRATHICCGRMTVRYSCQPTHKIHLEIFHRLFTRTRE